jgi:pimeloyl-ACP methyl ester carboxylesterase
MRSVVHSVITFIACLLLISGCSLGEIRKQIHVTESLGIIKGTVELSDSLEGAIIVRRYSLEEGIYVYESFERPSADGEYSFHVIPGTYYIAAFIDINRDAEYQSSEAGDYHGSESGTPAAIHVESGQTVTVGTITIAERLSAEYANTESRVDLSPVKENIGRVVNLDDAMFDRTNYSTGMWKPIQFLTEVGGGLLFLQEYQADKIPILFVHGINGGPTDWEAAIRNLDIRHFQPWVLYYPSGMRLDIISDYLVTAVVELHQTYGFKQLYVASHSMGGLVAKSFVQKYLDRFPEDKELISFMMTVNSPMNGMNSAVSGVNNSPIVIPAWHDVATDSAFLQDLNAWKWPDKVPYHLVFSYKTGGSNDGFVRLQSQIPLELQAEAIRIYGFNNTHVGTLNDAAFLELFNKVLAGSLAHPQWQ